MPEPGCAWDGAGDARVALIAFTSALGARIAACEDFGIGYRIRSIRLPAPMAVP